MKTCIKRYVTIRHRDGRITHFTQNPDLHPYTIDELRDMIDKTAQITGVEKVPYTELTNEEATAVLEMSEIAGGKICYNGQWLLLGRTSLTDDVRTGGTYSIAEHWRERMRFGARVDHRTFSIIDQYSDG